MDKNSIIGFVLIGLIMFGFFGYQSNQYKKQLEIQAQIDSVAAVEQFKQDSIKAIWLAEHPEDSVVSNVSAQQNRIYYTDSLLNSAAIDTARYIAISNDKMDLVFTTRGAQPYSIKLKDYQAYGNKDLYLMRPGDGNFSFEIYAPTQINTANFSFNYIPEESSDSVVVMRLPFSGDGYIQQKYVIEQGSYMVHHEISFVGMDHLIPRNVNSMSVDFHSMVPRLEKGYKNETQYSKLNYYLPGDKGPEKIGNGRSGSKKISTNVSWVAFQQQFFSMILRAPQGFTSGDFNIEFQPEGNDGGNLMSCGANLRAEFGQKTTTIPFEFYFGPNHYQVLKSYDQKYEKVIPLGGSIIGIFTKYVIIPIFNWLHKFIANFGLIILLMTLFIKIVVLPFSFKSYSSSAKMQAIKPEIDKLNEKYPKQEDAMKKQQATMALYKKAGISPMGGCLPMLLQFPILWAMFRFFPASIELRQQSFLWADDLSAYDSFIDFGTRIPLLGDHVSLFALLMAVSMWLYSKFVTGTQNSGNDPNAKMMQFMSVWMMPIMMFFICNSLSSGLSYYYLLSNLITMFETFIIKKFFVHPDEILAKLKAVENKPAPKSKWEQRLEEAQRMQRQMQEEQRKSQMKGGKRRR